ncbi:non-canonical purine NTP pyrophosphatase [Candidatus Berkelbacteria bacterium]|nr:non-canonical purine NTP pyrophosphatase [Candidatus Berkelbacteria bacterium]
MDVVFVTSNENKAREAREILGVPIEIQKLDLDEIQGMELEPIIRHKLQQAWDVLKRPVLVDDVGLYFEAWGGFPGPFVRFAAETMTEAGIARALGDDRRLRYVVTVGYTDGERTLFGSGEIRGTFTHEPRGTNGWGFDPFLLPNGEDQTYAQMGPEAKHKISARGQALRALKAQLGDR